MLTDKFFIAALIATALLVAGVLGMVLHWARRPLAVRSDPPAGRARLRVDAVRASFRQAVQSIESDIVLRVDRHAVPWIVVLDGGDDRSPWPGAQTGIEQAFGPQAALLASAPGIAWSRLDDAVVIAAQASILGSPDDGDRSEAPWDAFIDACRRYRPDRPLDAIVLALPAAALLDGGADGSLRLVERAKLAHRRLWLAQRRCAMRFAIHVVVTDAERIPGFGTFARALPTPLRDSMLGWSSPPDLDQPYRSAWVEAAIDDMERTVSDATAALFVEPGASEDAEDAEALMLLPTRVRGLLEPLRRYIDEAMRSDADHEAPFLRGIHLVGDIGDFDDSDDAGEVARSRTDFLRADHTSGRVEASPRDDPAARRRSRPVFLRDLFTQKIVPEHGVTRRSSRHRLARPLLRRVVLWSAVAALGVWSVALCIATSNLHRRAAEWAIRLDRLDEDARAVVRADRRGEALPASWYRERTLGLLGLGARLRDESLRAIAMPGSWLPFDSLQDRLANRVERAFGDVAMTTLRRELHARAIELAAPAQADDGTSTSISRCRLPPGFAELDGAPKGETLTPEDLPEFALLQRHVERVDELDASMQAMARLRAGGGVDDLRRVVHYALGARLPPDIGGSLRFFRRPTEAAASRDGTASDLDREGLQQALRCAFDRGGEQLEARLFAGNALLSHEARLTQSLARMAAAGSGSFEQFGEILRGMLATIQAQQNLVAGGAGGWMRQSRLNLGPAWDRLLARVADTPLLGEAAATSLRERAENGFRRFRADFGTAFDGAHAGIIWLDAPGRFALSPERAALRDALTTLLAQPFVTASTADGLPPLPSQAPAMWNAGRLDQALAISAVRQRFVTDNLPTFPAAMRADVQAAVDAHLARVVMARLSASIESGSADPGNAPEAAFNVARQRLAKAGELLVELGDPKHADELRTLVARDALTNLRAIDDRLLDAEPYALQARDVQRWEGGKAPLLAALGVHDATGLAAYLGQQASRLDSLGRQADIYLAALDATGAASAPARRWQAIARDLDRYRMKDPGSSLLRLEQYLAGPGSEADVGDCVEKLGRPQGGAPGDYFAERQADIVQLLRARCDALRLSDRHLQWQRFARHFDQALAGRYPFVEPPSPDARARAGDGADVDPADLEDVLRAFDPIQRAFGGLGTIARGAASGSSSQEPAVRSFIQQFGRASAFLAPLFPADGHTTPGYDVAVGFRAESTAEVEGRQIIDWSIDIGGQTLRQRDAPRLLRWRPGLPVAITLRLAKDAPLLAEADAGQPALTTDGVAVVYRFADPWALIRLIQQQRDTASGTRAEDASMLLRLEFPVRAKSLADTGQQPAGGRVRVYLRLKLSAPGRAMPLVWPGAFPVHAPQESGMP